MDETASLTERCRSIELCDRFESGWRSGRRPRIEEQLVGLPDSLRDELLLRLIRIERLARSSQGEQPTPEEYRARFADRSTLVAEAFAQRDGDEVDSPFDSTEPVDLADLSTRSFQGDGQPRRDRPADAPPLPSFGPRYRVIRSRNHPEGFVAEGGLGRIWKARDLALNRDVALKQIKPGIDPEAHRSQFLQEAEVIADLEHPGVIPIHDIERSGPGAPFYAMRFIRGETLSSVIARLHDPDPDRPRPALRDLVERMIAVCETVAQAHRKGVLHRDIKPGNIMLGPFGETFLVDWGLALIVEADGDDQPRTFEPPRARGERVVGTDGYLPPEQAEGDRTRQGPRSDVFGLGATLCRILTDRTPYDPDRQDRSTLLQRARSSRVPEPGPHAPGSPPALRAICRKAIRPDPEDRYDTPLELAEDLRRWLRDEPVSPYRDPISTRTLRWMRAHRPAALAIASALLVALIGSVVAVVVFGAQNRELERQTSIARNQRIRADAQYEQARLDRDALRNLSRGLAEVIDGDITSTLPAETRVGLALQAERLVDDHLMLGRDNPILLVEAARVFGRAANVCRMAGESEFAFALHNRALECLERTGRLGENPALDRLHATLLNELGNTFELTGQLAEAARSYGEALRISEQVSRIEKSENETFHLSRARLDLAGILGQIGRREEAIALLDRAAADFLELAGPAEEPAIDSGAIIDDLMLMLCEYSRARILLEDGQPAESIAEADRAIRRADLLLEAIGPDPAGELEQLAMNVAHVRAKIIDISARSLSSQGRSAEASAAFDEAIEELDRLADSDPTITYYRVDLAEALRNRAHMLRETGQIEASQADAFRSVLLLEQLLEEMPGNLAVADSLAGSLERLASSRPGAWNAPRLLDRAIEYRRRVAASNPEVPGDAEKLIEAIRLRNRAPLLLLPPE